MKLESKRVFITDLPESATEIDLEKKFSEFGNVTAVEIKRRKDVGPKNRSQLFAFVNLDVDHQSLQRCFEEFGNQKWKGEYVEIQLAKESFLDRLRKEREEAKSNEVVKTDRVQTNSSLLETKTKLTIKPKKSIVKKPLTSSSDDSSSDEEVVPVNKTKIAATNEDAKKEEIHNLYSDIIVKNNKGKILDNKIESVGNEPIIKIEIGKKKKKSKDPKRSEADQKRLTSIMEMKKGYNQQKSTIQSALSRIDLQPKSKIIFDDTGNSAAQTSKKKNDKRRELFDEEDDEADHDINFEVKKQFQGKTGQKLFELQSRYKNDERFQMDSRFVEEEDEVIENGHIENEEEISQEEEKQKQLEILGEVLGKKITSKSEHGSKKRVMLRFDPSQPDHAKYEVKDTEPKKKKKRKGEESESKEEEVLPEVSKEKFYQVTDVLKSSLQEKESFSLLTMFGRNVDGEKEMSINDEATEIVKHKKNDLDVSHNPFQYDSTDDEEAPEKKLKEPEISKEPNQNVSLGPKRLWTESFLFKDDDYRFQEGLDFIRRMEIDDTSTFHKLRRDLKEIVKAKVRNHQQNTKPFKKKLGASGRKNMIRRKKAMKR